MNEFYKKLNGIIGDELIATFSDFLTYLSKRGVHVDVSSLRTAETLKSYLREEQHGDSFVRPILQGVRELGSKAKLRDGRNMVILVLTEDSSRRIKIKTIYEQTSGNKELAEDVEFLARKFYPFDKKREDLSFYGEGVGLLL